MTAPTKELRSSRTDGHEPAVRLDAVSKVYGRDLLALDRVTLTAGRGEFVCLLGASGCGKSTLLNLVAGLDHATAGEIDTKGGRIAMMFQEPALFPWLTVSANIELALRVTGKGKSTTKKERRARAAELLEIVHLGGFGAKRPHELSGGMRQRVALARALAQEADVLLMDEPFGALDAMTRDLLHDELERIWRERELTVLFVTHNVREAVRLGDRVVLLSSRPGTVIQEFPITLDRPRRTDSGEVAGLAATITDRLRQEVLRHAKPARRPVATGARGDG
ncbi:ABC transporter ATP-binding protein [Sphaerisporangium album]|uniref:ABC transporter ATP-binding protein n=1 Tax=Sphaerisporangium album TaxID=509200 RepID=A0A367FI56_9ACTN|nr:ABC transporter ATP-binding protein [Sphaerisporangium album]RCG30011.1 ABC transporter ATP-binding protein [Sphaerisporangium album]